ncbi:unnamed protein product [Amoebophrya sp. A25]|nr:unnamed protein product [Amoebophrya sp. A25]|eukprot:GSA25T00014210001.1
MGNTCCGGSRPGHDDHKTKKTSAPTLQYRPQYGAHLYEPSVGSDFAIEGGASLRVVEQALYRPDGPIDAISGGRIVLTLWSSGMGTQGEPYHFRSTKFWTKNVVGGTRRVHILGLDKVEVLLSPHGRKVIVSVDNVFLKPTSGRLGAGGQYVLERSRLETEGALAIQLKGLQNRPELNGASIYGEWEYTEAHLRRTNRVVEAFIRPVSYVVEGLVGEETGKRFVLPHENLCGDVVVDGDSTKEYKAMQIISKQNRDIHLQDARATSQSTATSVRIPQTHHNHQNQIQNGAGHANNLALTPHQRPEAARQGLYPSLDVNSNRGSTPGLEAQRRGEGCMVLLETEKRLEGFDKNQPNARIEVEEMQIILDNLENLNEEERGDRRRLLRRLSDVLK